MAKLAAINIELNRLDKHYQLYQRFRLPLALLSASTGIAIIWYLNKIKPLAPISIGKAVISAFCAVSISSTIAIAGNYYFDRYVPSRLIRLKMAREAEITKGSLLLLVDEYKNKQSK
jgi:hypothetical protein